MYRKIASAEESFTTAWYSSWTPRYMELDSTTNAKKALETWEVTRTLAQLLSLCHELLGVSESSTLVVSTSRAAAIFSLLMIRAKSALFVPPSPRSLVSVLCTWSPRQIDRFRDSLLPSKVMDKFLLITISSPSFGAACWLWRCSCSMASTWCSHRLSFSNISLRCSWSTSSTFKLSSVCTFLCPSAMARHVNVAKDAGRPSKYLLTGAVQARMRPGSRIQTFKVNNLQMHPHRGQQKPYRPLCRVVLWYIYIYIHSAISVRDSRDSITPGDYQSVEGAGKMTSLKHLKGLEAKLSDFQVMLPVKITRAHHSN